VIPVDQDLFGMPYGNCFAACVASILELPSPRCIANVMWDDTRWFQRFNTWAATKGFQALCHPWNDAAADYIREHHRDSHIIAAGPAARGFDHCCVYRGLQLVHDPHPDRTGLDRENDWTIVWISDAGRFATWTESARCP